MGPRELCAKNMKEEYAYGYWDVKGTACPLKSAGLDDELHATDLAESFDSELIVNKDLEGDQGTIDRDTAEKVFRRLSVRYENAIETEDNREEYYRNMHMLCERVLEKEFNDD